MGRYTAQSTSNNSIQEMNVLNNPFSLLVVARGDIDATTNLTTGFNTYFKMQGWDPATKQYEVWHSMNTPLLNAPSGKALQNITILFSWIDR